MVALIFAVMKQGQSSASHCSFFSASLYLLAMVVIRSGRIGTSGHAGVLLPVGSLSYTALVMHVEDAGLPPPAHVDG